MVMVTTSANLKEGSDESGSVLDWTGSLIGCMCECFDWRWHGGGSERCRRQDKAVAEV